MSKICHATIIDKDENHIGELTGMVFPMGFFIAHTQEGRVFYGKIDPLNCKMKEIYEYRNS